MKKLGLIFAVVLFAFISVFTLSCGKDGKKTTYEIECSLSNDYVLSGVETVAFYNDTEHVFKELKFNLFGNAYRKEAKYSPISKEYYHAAYPNGLSYGGMDIKSVKEGEENLEFSVCGEDQNILLVTLKEEVFPNESVKVKIEYNLSLANVVSRTGYNDNTVNLANFYPVLCGIDQNGFYECLYYAKGDPFFSDVANYTVNFSCNKDYVVAAPCESVISESVGDTVKNTYVLENARSFNLVLSKNFKYISVESEGVKINYYYYNDENPKENLDYATKSIKTFNDLFGAYPYKEYSVVQTGFVQGGMEFPGIVMISDALEQKAFGEVIVHETAHQWWQTGVGNNEIEYGFLDEGLAEYSVVLFYENNPEYSYTREALIKSSEQTYKMYCTVYDKLFGKVDTSMMRPLKEFKSEYEYVNIAYVKPCIMYDYLRTTIGDQKFFNGLKEYYKKYCYKNATPSDLVGVFEKIGAGTNGFFDSFFSGKVII